MTEFVEGDGFRRSINLGLGEKGGGGWIREGSSQVAQNELLLLGKGQKHKVGSSLHSGCFAQPSKCLTQLWSPSWIHVSLGLFMDFRCARRHGLIWLCNRAVLMTFHLLLKDLFWINGKAEITALSNSAKEFTCLHVWAIWKQSCGFLHVLGFS